MYFGGGSRNAGFVVESQESCPVAIRVVKIDAGEAFNFGGEDNQFMQSFTPFYRGNKLVDPLETCSPKASYGASC